MRTMLLSVSAAALLLTAAAGQARAVEGGTGDVRISYGFAEGTLVTGGKLNFAGKDGAAQDWDAGKGNSVRLPAGEYQLRAGQLVLSDADGATWQVQLAGSKAFKVPADGTVLLKLGGPFKVEAVTAGKAVPGGTLAVKHKLLGASGEGYGLIYKTAPSRGLPPAPAVAVEDSEGKTVAKGSMEYGWGGSCGYSASIPQDLKLGADGTAVLKVKVSADTGPLGGKVTGTGEVKVSKE